jgi:hypothetical protein
MSNPVESTRALWADLLQNAKTRIVKKTDMDDNEDIRVEVAFYLASAIGKCRRYGVSVSDEDQKMLTPALANTAISKVRQFISGVEIDLSYLKGRIDEGEGLESEEVCLDILGCRETIAAVLEAVTETYMREPEAKQLGENIGQIADIIMDLDDKMQKKADTLSLAASTHWLENQRLLLADEFRELMPWWLDGTLEKRAKAIELENKDPWLSQKIWEAIQKMARAKARE